MQRLFSAFPNGYPGGGLLLLRLVVALNVAAEGFFFLYSPDRETSSWWLGGLAILTGALVLMGFMTPVCCGLAAAGNLILNLVRLPASQTPALASSIVHLNLAIISMALVLLGPGAFSLDARLFGRREIIISDSKQD